MILIEKQNTKFAMREGDFIRERYLLFCTLEFAEGNSKYRFHRQMKIASSRVKPLDFFVVGRAMKNSPRASHRCAFIRDAHDSD